MVPSLATPLSEGLNIYVDYVHRVNLTIGEEKVVLHSTAGTVRDLFREKFISLSSLDTVVPGLDTKIYDDLDIRVNRINMAQVIEREYVPFSEIYNTDDSVDYGDTTVISVGKDGLVERMYIVKYQDGREVSRQLVSVDYSVPEDRVVTVGSRIVPAPPPPIPEPPEGGTTMDGFATGYNAVSAGGNITFTGLALDYGICATDPSVIPMGTRFYVPGYGECLAADTGGLIIGNRIDIGYPGDTVGHCCTGWMTIQFYD